MTLFCKLVFRRGLLAGILSIGAASAPTFAATITVTNANDLGTGSLRQAMLDATAGDTIHFNFNYPATIHLDSQLTVNKDLSIIGPGAQNLVLDGTVQFPLVWVNSGSTASISGLLLTLGRGGIVNQGTLTASDMVITDSYTHNDPGGGIINVGVLTLNTSRLSGNKTDTKGGAIYNGDGATLTVNGSTFSGANRASDDGGGLANFGSATINNSTFSGNVAAGNHPRGGAIFNFGTLAVTNSTFVGNVSSGPGGALFNNGPATLIASTFTNNAAAPGDNGDAFYNFDTITVSRTIVTTGCSGPGTLASMGDNIGGCFGDSLVLNDRNLDPLLAVLADNGGPTQTQALQAGSPALDEVRVNSATCSGTDQRGVARPSGVRCDIGAVEMDFDHIFHNGFE
ncbi:hypothetical protein ELE36_12040 [Pseudolysobacter antarcticus]|uniref:CSLREA domain-containing protein n=1 Tax=Pseudolysobacter antarcticus TaxID=2511995 RepID=A0A411HKU3_9GAMM|nr:choice-of-anchor Q domain-containing protein [Pseudolysobacter antarcticus]QBB71020.1 hypothetical protein ELE36_12040 [Pseudolysobacter antarcticus]